MKVGITNVVLLTSNFFSCREMD